MRTRIRTFALFLALVLAAGGCASSRSGQVYSRDQALRAQQVRMGTVEAINHVQIEGTKSGTGTLSGAALGGVMGASIGRGYGSAIAAVAGAIAGGLAGSAAEEALTKRPGLEITVKLDGGKTIAVVQEADESFKVGDRVRVLTSSDGTTRVRH